MKKYLRPTLWALLGLLVLAQLIRPAKNLSAVATHDISTKYRVPDEVQAILKPACFDCHSNYTRYPWYFEVQPVAAWLNNHIQEGKGHLNFNEFSARPIAEQNHLLEEIVEMVREEEMPLRSYTLIHRDAVLSGAQRETLIHWATALQDTLRKNYPADSLIMPKHEH